MWHRPFLFVACMLTLPALSGAKTGENETMAVCPLCFAPSLPMMYRTRSDGDRRVMALLGCGLGRLWAGCCCGRGSLWLQKWLCFSTRRGSGPTRASPGMSQCQAAAARGVDAAPPPPHASRNIPLFVPDPEKDSSPANTVSSRRATSCDPQSAWGRASCPPRPWVRKCYRHIPTM